MDSYPREVWDVNRHRMVTVGNDLELAGAMYDPERHDPDSVGFDDSYTGPSERELNGGCNRCGGWDDCYCVDR